MASDLNENYLFINVQMLTDISTVTAPEPIGKDKTKSAWGELKFGMKCRSRKPGGFV